MVALSLEHLDDREAAPSLMAPFLLGGQMVSPSRFDQSRSARRERAVMRKLASYVESAAIDAAPRTGKEMWRRLLAAAPVLGRVKANLKVHPTRR
jgi:hypothetical protein